MFKVSRKVVLMRSDYACCEWLPRSEVSARREGSRVNEGKLQVQDRKEGGIWIYFPLINEDDLWRVKRQNGRTRSKVGCSGWMSEEIKYLRLVWYSVSSPQHEVYCSLNYLQ